MITLNRIKMLLFLILILPLCIKNTHAQTKVMGEPVPGAEVYIELEPDNDPIANVTTNENGEFEIVFSNSGNGLSNIGNLPSIGTLNFTIKPPKSFALKNNLVDKKLQKIKVRYDKRKDFIILKNGNFVLKYILTWVVNTRAENKGSFAVSGKNST